MHVHVFKDRLLHNVFEDKKTRLFMLLCLDNLRKKKHMNHGVYRKLQIGLSFLLCLTTFR